MVRLLSKDETAPARDGLGVFDGPEFRGCFGQSAAEIAERQQTGRVKIFKNVLCFAAQPFVDLGYVLRLTAKTGRQIPVNMR